MIEEETIVHPASLDERAADARQSEDGAIALIEEFLPFMKGRVVKYSYQLDESTREDMLNIAMSAFYEAVHSYDIKKGHFYPFANRVVCARLIDHVRMLNKHEVKSVPLETDNEDSYDAHTSAIDLASIRSYEEGLRHELLVEEIEQFKSEIAVWGITLEDLEKASPKHSQLRKLYKEIVAIAVKTPEIAQTILIKHYFPITAVVQITGYTKKMVERARTYVLASFIIETGDYDLLSEYIQ